MQSFQLHHFVSWVFWGFLVTSHFKLFQIRNSWSCMLRFQIEKKTVLCFNLFYLKPARSRACFVVVSISIAYDAWHLFHRWKRKRRRKFCIKAKKVIYFRLFSVKVKWAWVPFQQLPFVSLYVECLPVSFFLGFLVGRGRNWWIDQRKTPNKEI